MLKYLIYSSKRRACIDRYNKEVSMAKSSVLNLTSLHYLLSFCPPSHVCARVPLGAPELIKRVLMAQLVENPVMLL